VRGAPRLIQDATSRTRAAIILAVLFVCLYAIAVVGYVVTLPDIGVRSAFSTEVSHFFPEFRFPENQVPLKHNDRILEIGGEKTEDWPHLLRRLVELRHPGQPVTTDDPAALRDDPAALRDQEKTHLIYQGVEIIKVRYEPANAPGTKSTIWCKLGRSSLDTLLPTVLWFFIKAGLVVVGMLVFWTRPEERPARLFFLLSVVSCGAYLGGYHWQAIVTQPVLLIVFMATSILLPAVSLHFYLVFPRPKPIYEHRPKLTLTALYGPPVIVLVALLLHYVGLRWVVSTGTGDARNSKLVESLLEGMLAWIFAYFWIALVLYLLSIVCLVYSYRKAGDTTERNQVKWILIGSVFALLPLGWSLYLATQQQEEFSGGKATWPMFCASLCVTLAFTISMTRYRLLELDKLVTSGAAYLSLTVVAGLVYYGLVIVGVLLLGSRLIAVPTLAQALGVGGTVLLLVVLLDLARGRLKKALDRHFRREKIQLDRTLQRMSQAIAQLVDPPTLARRLLGTTTELLGIGRGAVYLREGDPALYRLADSVGEAPPLTELSPGCPLIEALQNEGRIGLHPQEPGQNGHNETPALRQLHFLGGEVAFALSHEGQMLALLVLGRRNVDAYSSEDLNLLSAFAQVTALALVSSEGGRTIEALNRELKTKVEKIAEQQRRIMALQSQLLRKDGEARPKEEPRPETPPACDTLPALVPPPVVPDGQSSNGSHRSGIIGGSPAVERLLHLIRKVASSSSAVLLRGESGTGKELLARAVHEYSARAAGPFIKVHCAALAPGLLESELFGHVKGAYTGAVRDRPGRFELAHGGTLFLDEIGDVSWEVQTKLLRVLQEMTFERVGSSEPVQVDVRIIAATHQDLDRLIRQGRFREDLFYRLNVLPIAVPPLRERREDIPELVQHFLSYYGPRCGKPGLQVDDEALVLLKSAYWKGNIRQLENVIERAVIIAEGTSLTGDDLPPDLLADPAPIEDLQADSPLGLANERVDRERREREQLVRALAATNGNKAEAARALGLKRSTLVSRLKKYGLS
jgi:transcriptional regulator with GAF, ATPase, and Fis domain